MDTASDKLIWQVFIERQLKQKKFCNRLELLSKHKEKVISTKIPQYIWKIDGGINLSQPTQMFWKTCLL